MAGCPASGDESSCSADSSMPAKERTLHYDPTFWVKKADEGPNRMEKGINSTGVMILLSRKFITKVRVQKKKQGLNKSVFDMW